MKSSNDIIGKDKQATKAGLSPFLLHNAKVLLKNYRPVVWATTQRTLRLYQDAQMATGKSLESALEFLSEYAPEQYKARFQDKVTSLVETQWLVEVVDTALVKVNEYPKNGKLYFELINKTYIAFSSYTLYEILEALSLSRSSYYQKKKEAINLFAIALWGYALPQIKGIASIEVPAYYYI